MFEPGKLCNLDDYFLPLNQRSGSVVYVCRLGGYNQNVENFLQSYLAKSTTGGLVQIGKIPNPNEQNLRYFQEMLGSDFVMQVGFFAVSLKTWLPRLTTYQNQTVATAIYDTLDELRKNGKNMNILKNVYTKFMCWMYYRFERVIRLLGQKDLPKILYHGTPSDHEFRMLNVLALAGCDVLLVQCQDENLSVQLFKTADMGEYPRDFSLESLKQKQMQQAELSALPGGEASISGRCNGWHQKDALTDLLVPSQSRGSDGQVFLNSCRRMVGVADKVMFQQDLFQFHQSLTAQKRNVVVVEGVLPVPTVEEISAVVRGNYSSISQAIAGLSKNIQWSSSPDLKGLMVQAFVETMTEFSKNDTVPVNRLVNQGVYLLCWLKRYQGDLFRGWRMPALGCFLYLGCCQTVSEVLFFQFLSRLPVDILILACDLGKKCLLPDALVLEERYGQSIQLQKFPCRPGEMQVGTAAYHAERELDTLLYTDSGMYRNRQFQKATAVTLQTMYEEIALLWDAELKFRPGFATNQEEVHLPVIFAKVSGVKDGAVSNYWADLKKLTTKETLVVDKTPYLTSTDPNPMKPHASKFYRNGRLQRQAILSCPAYGYGFLRQEVQTYLLDKLELLLDRKTICGMGQNGMEFTVIAVALNLNQRILRMVQGFDFTQKNPKILYLHTKEQMPTVEDAILLSYLNLLGFDIAIFVPTGYQCVEAFFQKKILDEHQLGAYLYDLQTPQWNTALGAKKPHWSDKLFRRGGS